MKLREYQAKEIFASRGIAVPRGQVVTTAAQAEAAARALGGAVVLKPQLGVKGRGKVGGIGFAETPALAAAEAARLLGAEIKGERVSTLLVEQRAQIEKELYLAVAVDYAARRPVLMASDLGGVEIEQAADLDPGAILRLPGSVLRPPAAPELAEVDRRLGPGAGEVLRRLYEVFVAYDAEQVEINPLARTPGGLLALDAVLNVNPDSVSRHPELLALARQLPADDPLVAEAAARSWTYIDLGGDIAILSSGAGLTMTIVDLITRAGGSAANFLDTAQIDAQGIGQAFALLTRARPPRAWLVNIFAGLNRCDDLARGIVAYLGAHPLAQPLVVRMVGNQEDQGHAILREAGVEPVTELEQAVQRCVALAGQGGAA